MSLVLLKNLLLFRRAAAPAAAASSPPLATERTPLLDPAGACEPESDLESQTTQVEDGERRASLSRTKRFRVDARLISDATIGLSDGLTVPFALTAGLSALGDTRVVIFGGLAELIAGAISMGLGGYLGAMSEYASYQATRKEVEAQVARSPREAAAAVHDVFAPYDVPAKTLDELASHMASHARLADFVLRFHHGAEAPAPGRALASGLTIALAYLVGGLVPLAPYVFVGRRGGLATALWVSAAVMAAALFGFGYAKTCAVAGWRGPGAARRGAAGGLQMVVVGGAAAAAAMGLVKAFNQAADAAGG